MTGLAMREREQSWQEIWANARDQLRIELGQGVFDTWIAPLYLLDATDGHVRLSAPRRLVRDYVALHHATRVERTLAAQTKAFASLEVIVSAAEPRVVGAAAQSGATGSESNGNAARKGPAGANGGDVAGRGGNGLWDHVPDAKQSFENFVIGPSNEFAFKAARRLAETNDPDITILYLHGGFGFGKTHLLNAIALESRKARGARTLFLRAEDFMRRFLGALREKDTLAFKEELRCADILLIDDLQHICGKAATVSEFLHTVNTFADLKRKIVIAADRAPVALEGLPDGVRSRLQGALVIALEKPDVTTRLAILKAKAAELERKSPRVALPTAVLEHMAEALDASPRELIGVFNKLAIYADLTSRPVTMEVADETIASRTSPLERRVTVEEIQRKTAEFYKLDLRELHSPRRARRVARPRQVAMFLARELTSRSLPDIGRRFGGRDHTTVLHACRRIEELCRADPLLQQEVDFLRNLLARTQRI
jgi:chromosomal replication initiator protein